MFSRWSLQYHILSTATQRIKLQYVFALRMEAALQSASLVTVRDSFPSYGLHVCPFVSIAAYLALKWKQEDVFCKIDNLNGSVLPSHTVATKPNVSNTGFAWSTLVFSKR